MYKEEEIKEYAETQIKEYLNQAEILGKIENLKATTKNQPHLENVNKQKKGEKLISPL